MWAFAVRRILGNTIFCCGFVDLGAASALKNAAKKRREPSPLLDSYERHGLVVNEVSSDEAFSGFE